MAREYARIRVSIADDEDIEKLSAAAQWLYFRVMIPDPGLNLAGVLDWRPIRLLRKASGLTLDYINDAAAELECANYVLFDLSTEEAMVRTRIRSDEVLRNPKTAIGIVNAARTTSSNVLRAAIVSEVRKAKEEHPDYTAWEHPISSAGLTDLLSRRPLADSDYVRQIGYRIGNPIGYDITNPDRSELVIQNGPITNEIGDAIPNPDRSDSTRDLSPKPKDKRSRSSASPPTVRYSDDFDRWWSIYPKKKAKAAAAKAFAKVVKTTTVDELVKITEAYAASVQGSEERFIPHGATWLNDRRFEDDEYQPTDARKILQAAWKSGPNPALSKIADEAFYVDWPDPYPESEAERDAERLRQWRAWVEANRDTLLERIASWGWRPGDAQ